MFLCRKMYLKLVLLAFVVTAAAIDDGGLHGLIQDEPTEAEIETSTLLPVTEQEDKPKTRYHYQPQSVQYPPDTALFQKQYDYRYSDGSYEYRYELPNQTVRYEKGFYVDVHHKRILVKRGYYSYPLADGRFMSVYFTADQNGYRQDSSIFWAKRPPLHQHLSGDENSTEEVTQDYETENPTALIDDQ